ncbi:TPA: YfjI family protein [Legionella pneumophila]|uniref:DUF3987 domain-containing protein n=4 Tax=Legionella pneumophila TaxID=446 RepID=A0AAN5KTY5_LEGPN|nr:YfjI family protein [Legionella pneumophila]HAT9273148.1 DUF3987 domain-containing protein [Legionella pneumophila subsp. pneumophila]MCZ4723737.1 YfjI family protein [Legionella pneumophila]MCZ4728665.1 YfjI family protein [Legionella pneumophila]MCZ4733994.1 YfjI family protein [Legionella pneumophila]MDW8897915.1 YfjI family protein [Legionella pneumophila]
MSAENIKALVESMPFESPSPGTDLPEPLPTRNPSIKYPLEALGNILGEAAKRIAYHVQVPEGMAGQSVLAAAGLVAQGYINVQRGSIGLSPVSIFCLSVAESGDRKSSVDRLALAPIRAYESERALEMPTKEQKYKAEIEAWGVRRNSIIKSYKKPKAELSEEEQKKLFERLFQLELSKPRAPSRSNITFSEPTSEGIWKHYIQGEPSAGLFSDEGISFFGGHGMNDEAKGRTIHILSKLWDGDPISRTRGGEGESGVLANRRLSSHLMIQPIVAKKVFTDQLLQGQGVLSRFLICHEPSIAGSRLLSDRDLEKGANSDPAIAEYWQRLTNLLNQPQRINELTGQLQLTVFALSGKALDVWCALHDGIEEQLRSDGRFIDIKAFASKAAENAARIAAILAFVEGYDRPMVEHVERAGVLISYYLESMSLRTTEAQYDVNELLANDLLEWVVKKGGKLSADQFKTLPPVLRKAKTARILLKILVDTGHMHVAEINKKTGKPAVWEVSQC